MRNPYAILMVAVLVGCGGCASFPPQRLSPSVGQRFYRDVTLIAVSENDIIIRRNESDPAPITILKDGKAHTIGQLEAIKVLEIDKHRGAEVEVSSVRRFGFLTFPPD
ncbi:MAG: hypothetical protein NTY01_02165 [Verrucomicrobia bacterium]|nr:hypothetical protein [Verrucomicrobiota bacterium]